MTIEIAEWKSVMGIDAHVESFDMRALKELAVKSDYKLKDEFKETFEYVIREKFFDADSYEKLTGLDFEHEEGIHLHLQAIYDYVYNDGSIDDIDEVEEIYR